MQSLHIPGQPRFFQWPLWLYIDAEDNTPHAEIDLFSYPDHDQSEVRLLPLFTTEEISVEFAAGNIPDRYQPRSLGSNGLTSILKKIAWPNGVRFLTLDQRVSTIAHRRDYIPLPQFVADNQNPWWTDRQRIGREAICAYCGKETDKDSEPLEHVIPESLGCRETLYRGAVCAMCNSRLSKVDEQAFQEALFASGQIATDIPGKKGKPRKSLSKHVTKKRGGMSIKNAQSGKPNEFRISRLIAKCVVNTFVNSFGSQTSRMELFEIIEYVLMPKSNKDVWPFAAIYTPTGFISSVHFGLDAIDLDGEKHPIAYFICASGLFASSPYKHVTDLSSGILDFLHKTVAEIEKSTNSKIGMNMTYLAE